jgi:ribonuclease HII
MTGARYICGVDETGRGPLAGPVYAAAVVLDPKRRIRGLADSKQLTAEQREVLAAKIRTRALAWAVASASVEEIDTYNILRASLLAMRRAVLQLGMVPTEVLVDGLHCPLVPCRATAIVKGDESVPAISAASIIAKVARDAEMLVLHTRYPQYGFDQHKGYPTEAHFAALALHGPCVIHRRTFAPVRIAIEAAHGPSQFPLW